MLRRPIEKNMLFMVKIRHRKNQRNDGFRSGNFDVKTALHSGAVIKKFAKLGWASVISRSRSLRWFLRCSIRRKHKISNVILSTN